MVPLHWVVVVVVKKKKIKIKMWRRWVGGTQESGWEAGAMSRVVVVKIKEEDDDDNNIPATAAICNSKRT